MEAQYAEAKGELLGEMKAKTTSVTVKDFTPMGVRTENNFQGEIKGRINARITGTATVLAKPDGTSEYEVRSINITNDGDVVLVTSTKGRGWVENPTASRIEGEDAYQTASKKLAWLNGVKGRHEGTLNPVTGEGTIKLYGKT